MFLSTTTAAVHDDFFAVSGTGFPTNFKLEFAQGGTTKEVTPEFVRPHFALISKLPSTIPVGNNTLKLNDGTSTSNSLPVTVSAGSLNTVTVLQAGANKSNPYTIAFVGNPAILESSGVFTPDPILTQRHEFQETVVACFHNLFDVAEDLLKAGDIDAQMQFVTVFDDSLPPTNANSLAAEYPPDMMETRRSKIAPLLARYGIIADMVFVLHGSTTHDRATAWFTSDDPALPATPFTYDGNHHVHGHFCRVPGSAAIPLSVDPTGLTVIHEFGHAASDFVNGKVEDLYVDGSPAGFNINKKWRVSSSIPVPANFATYNGFVFQSDPARDGLGYPSTWRSFHPELIDPGNPNLMDNYWLAADPHDCRLDALTYAWFRNRLHAKLNR